MTNPIIGPQKGPGVSEVFGFRPYDFARHPSYDISAFWQEVCLDVNPPFGAPSVRFELNRFPRNTWVDLQDAAGQPIPLSIFVDPRGALFGRWLQGKSPAVNAGPEQFAAAPSAPAAPQAATSAWTTPADRSVESQVQDAFAAKEQEIREMAKTNPEMARRMELELEQTRSNMLSEMIRIKSEMSKSIWK